MQSGRRRTPLIATSSSVILSANSRNAAAHHPERVPVGHPVQPPHLIPLVEVVGGHRLGGSDLRGAGLLYSPWNKPIHIRLEIKDTWLTAAAAGPPPYARSLFLVKPGDRVC